MAATTHDPVSVEIHRKALENITTEMAITLTRTSGSPVVYEVQDFATCLMDTAGEHLSMSATILFHAGSSLLGTQAVIASLEDGEEVKPGDGWIVNDPFEAGAMHQGDVAIIMPQFFEDRHIGWAFSNVHVADVGGMGISGFAPGAVSVYDEGLRFVSTKIISDGVLDRGWERHLQSNVRVSNLLLNDLRGMIAANNVAQQKLTEVVSRFGYERFVEYCEINKTLSEEAFRERIRKLPDGVYKTSDWVEFDGHGEDLLLEVEVTMEIDDSDIRFDFQADEQTDAFINGTRGVAYGSLMTTFLTTLAYGDLPFNAGMWRPLTINIGDPGTVVNAVPPAPLSAAHSTAGMRVTRAIKDLLNQACANSEDPVIRSRVAGMAADGVCLVPLVGIGRGGAPTVVFFMDNVTGNGGGAQSLIDGQDCYGVTIGPGVGLTSIETNEASQPALYLWRKLVQNSGGPGIYRGGQGLEIAYAVHGSEQLDGAVAFTCAEIPSRGAGGGYPASTGSWSATHGTNVSADLEAGRQVHEETLTGDTPRVPSNLGRLHLGRGDVIRVGGGGGGGVGDPILRDPELVAGDVADEYVTAENARVAYGVVVDDDGAVDAAATEALRAEIRAERIGAAPKSPQGPPETPGISVSIGADGHWHCAYCEGDLGDGGEDWRERAVGREASISERLGEAGMHVRLRQGAEPVMIAEHYCPECAGLLLADLYPEGFTALDVARLKSTGAAVGA
ncbi:MAG TPA: hydantoinase B/oxoprolinase family protein [Solirubrobacterales bacterium]|nr:hydantoinase B/oxoprolinase family protein [Solirubrobacterales bacterium]